MYLENPDCLTCGGGGGGDDDNDDFSFSFFVVGQRPHRCQVKQAATYTSVHENSTRVFSIAPRTIS